MYGIKFYVNFNDMNDMDVQNYYKEEAVKNINSKYQTSYSIYNCESFYDYTDIKNIYSEDVKAIGGKIAFIVIIG